MERLHFDVLIDAPRPTVWETMLGDETFRDWTAAFMEGSYYEGSWREGEKIRFLSPDGSGMVAEIAENRPHEFVSIRHLGVVHDGVDDTESEEARAFAPAYENYTFSDVGSSTRVQVDMDVSSDSEDFMRNAWPKALERLKAISEAGPTD